MRSWAVPKILVADAQGPIPQDLNLSSGRKSTVGGRPMQQFRAIRGATARPSLSSPPVRPAPAENVVRSDRVRLP